MKLNTLLVQAGYSPENGQPRVTPITQSTTYKYDSAENMADLFDFKATGYFYARLGNPTTGVFEDKMTALDGGVGALATASGMSATLLTVLNLAESGDNIVSSAEIYGGTYNLFKHTLKKLGIECRFFNIGKNTAADVEALIDDKTKLVFAETLANPAMTVCDFDAISSVCKKKGVVFAVDNTLATPVICRPLEHGVNIVVYSSSKYLDGHATALGGVIVDGGNFDYVGNTRYAAFNTPDETYHGLVFAKDFGKAGFIIRARGIGMRDLGPQMSPMNAFLTNLGTETLHLRMPRHSENALAVAEALKDNPAVEWVRYAGLPSDKDYKNAQKYFTNGMASGMVTFGIKGGRDAAGKFQRALKLVAIVTHIADTRSCVLHPASTTHRQLSDADMEACGIPVNLIRLSIGIEDKEDILADILNALKESQK